MICGDRFAVYPSVKQKICWNRINMVKILGRNRLVKIGIIGMLFSIILLFLVPGPVNSAEVIDRIVAVVNGDIILLTELNWELKSGVAGIKAKKFPADKEEEELS